MLRILFIKWLDHQTIQHFVCTPFKCEIQAVSTVIMPAFHTYICVCALRTWTFHFHPIMDQSNH